jgi:hypothetical protein
MRSPVQCASTRRLDAGRSEGRQARPGTNWSAITGRIKGIIKNNRSDYRTDRRLIRYMAKTMAAMAWSLRVGRLNRRAGGGRDRHRYWSQVTATGKCREIMKKCNRNSQRQGKGQRPAPEATASRLARHCGYGGAGSFHREPLYPREISRLGDVFKARDFERRGLRRTRTEETESRLIRHFQLLLVQSSLASRFTAAAAGFLLLAPSMKSLNSSPVM